MVDDFVPTRFLAMTAHLVAIIILFWSKDSYVQSNFVGNVNAQEYAKKSTEFTIALSASLVCLLVEIVGFFAGFSMFNAFISITCKYICSPVRWS
ncbi:unnamed protein product [Soboliphyme baturini]|uniref:Transmembrane protein 107 n=1 Tax=Soboliphyme baturini TaxID=241478 RepID=A0A183J564_9BILA|nr:unnamed protein product [Soboliphyme baturini]